ncbi:hypothetical protein [Sinomicrobium weinanense]|uniref:Lipocalin-like domain-containing protein n=1 Tax=Sinomicrobium weinanense TaxID=2842200 RepID=A0A926JS16_9FLAO|nr:hypothetical protein [Sinomicrobium weinanense]MBC9796445.1 hypothetical protein [Sinomicrobium weinanense]MBU3125881.1 hypothetical protein [Sinomicrobium weinanense]
MKNVFLLLTCLIIFSCYDENYEQKLVGTWKVTQANFAGKGFSDASIQSFKESAEKTTYQLKQDKSLVFDFGNGMEQKVPAKWDYKEGIFFIIINGSMKETYKILTLDDHFLIIKSHPSRSKSEYVELHMERVP